MPVTTTPQDIIDAAYGRSLQNQPGQIATESTELLNLVNRSLRGIYAFAARINPTFFAEKATVAHDGTGWPRPEAAESIFRLEMAADGSEIAVVPYDDKQAEEGMPSVYRFGQTFFTVGGADDPAGTDDIDFFYAKRPQDPGGLNQTLDPHWAEQFNELLVLEVAIYLAIKDDRGGEMTALVNERNRWARRLAMFLEHETANERRRHSHLRRINTNSLFPIGSSLAGEPPGFGGGGGE